MIAALALADPEAGAAELARRFGFTVEPGAPLRLRFGGQRLHLCDAGTPPPPGLIAMAADHLALAVPDLAAIEAEVLSRGARRDARFTPDGPREIAEFGPSGVRFVFFEGPEGWPLEFVTPRRGPRPAAGHDHLGLRVRATGAAVAELSGLGARLTARHRLDGPVDVAFLRLGGAVIEVFDEAPLPGPPRPGGWIGLLPEAG